MTAGVTTADGKSGEWTPWHCLSFSELYCMGWIGPKVKNQKSKAWAVKIRFIVFLTLPLKRTFLFQELLIRLKKKERRTRGEENMLHYPYEESCASPSHWENSNRIYSKKAFPMITHSLVVLPERFINNVSAQTVEFKRIHTSVFFLIYKIRSLRWPEFCWFSVLIWSSVYLFFFTLYYKISLLFGELFSTACPLALF